MFNDADEFFELTVVDVDRGAGVDMRSALVVDLGAATGFVPAGTWGIRFVGVTELDKSTYDWR